MASIASRTDDAGDKPVPVHQVVLSDSCRDDYSSAFHKVRSRLVDDAGRSYVEFIRGLRPDFRRVYLDIALGYTMLLVTATAAAGLLRLNVPAGAVIVFGALCFGYWIAYLQLFIHEAAHFNLAQDRMMSDRLGNLLIAWMVGTSVAQYRKVHFQHHRALGTTQDSEFSYFFPLTTWFFIKSLCGLKALEVVLAREKHLSRSSSRSPARTAEWPNERGDQPQPTGSRLPGGLPYLMAGVVVHVGLLLAAWQIGLWPLAIAWIIGIGMLFPFFAALRPFLEHRNDAAQNGIDYRLTDQGAYTRLFGDDIVSATFGGAGFNRHLLHHWEPQVSYTRLHDLEAFLARTDMKDIMDSRRSSYAEIFLKFLSL
jgi:hypothetical protein